jgi:hypothetical protein
MISPRYDAHTALPAACEGMLAYIRQQLAEDDMLTPGERVSAPLAALEDALGTRDETSLINAGLAAAEWIVRDASEDEQFEWDVGCPQPDVDAYEVAVRHLQESDAG